MKTVLRDEESGVSEVIGTILILAMTVVLFASIILWVGSIPTPTTQTRVDIRPTLTPLYDGSGNEIGVNITLLHRGVEPLRPAPTIIYVTSQRGTNPPQTDTEILHAYNPLLLSGILDGRDIVWDIGERWAYESPLLRSTDQISVSVVDIFKNQVVWTAAITAPAGTRPPVFVSKWTDDKSGTPSIDPVQATLGFVLYARVIDSDNDLNRDSVYATLTIWFGIASPCAQPQKMHDDGVFPDVAAGDDIFSLGANQCMDSPFPDLQWDGSIILMNATDLQGHQTGSRMTLNVVVQTEGGITQTIPSELWQYIGFIQIRAGQVWYTHMNEPYTTSNRFQPFRVTKTDLTGNGGALFQLQMENHGNRTIFIDGWTVSTFSASNRASVFNTYIVKPVDASKPANAGGVGAYPGNAANPANFQYAQVFDINPFDQETGGAPTVVLLVSTSAFSCCSVQNWVAGSYFMSILVSGMSGPADMTYQQIIARWGAGYNPYDHLNDADPATRTQWYAQVIPFIGMTVY